MSAEIHGRHHEQVLTLLAQARMFMNMTHLDSKDVDAWHRQVDAMLHEYPKFDHPKERWDDPERVARREYVRGLF